MTPSEPPIQRRPLVLSVATERTAEGRRSMICGFEPSRALREITCPLVEQEMIKNFPLLAYKKATALMEGLLMLLLMVLLFEFVVVVVVVPPPISHKTVTTAREGSN